MASVTAALRRIKADPASLLDSAVIERACRLVGHRFRRRVLDPLATLAAFVAQILHGNTAIAHVVRLFEGRFNASAYCQARARLPVAVFRAVLDAANATLQGFGRSPLWRGHRVLLVDGTCCDMPDAAPLRDHFGMAGKHRPGCGFPLAKVLTLFHAATGHLLDMFVEPYRASELGQTPRLLGLLRRGDVLVGDRQYDTYAFFALLMAQGVHAVVRMRTFQRVMPFPARRRRRRYANRHRCWEPRLIRAHSAADQVVELLKPRDRPPWMTPEQFAALPPVLVLRALRYSVAERGFRTQEVALLTDLLEPARYPADAVADLYAARWRAETNIRYLKRTLGMNSLHTTSVEGVTKELLMFALVYNAVCAVRLAAARRQGVEPWRISFIDTLRWMRTQRGARPAAPPALVVNPLRPGRAQPRIRKRPPPCYIIMLRPRHTYAPNVG